MCYVFKTDKSISMNQRKTALLTHWCYCSLALSHGYDNNNLLMVRKSDFNSREYHFGNCRMAILLRQHFKKEKGKISSVWIFVYPLPVIRYMTKYFKLPVPQLVIFTAYHIKLTECRCDLFCWGFNSSSYRIHVMYSHIFFQAVSLALKQSWQWLIITVTS